MTDKKFEIGGALVVTGKKNQHKEKFEAVLDQPTSVPISTGATLDDIYDRYSKLLYLFDKSGSMREGMEGDDKTAQYFWTPELLVKFRAAMQNDNEPELEDDEAMDEEELDEAMNNGFVINPGENLTDEQLKAKIVSEGLAARYGIPLPKNITHHAKSQSKMSAVKEAAKQFVTDRFKKYSDARVIIFEFDERPTLLTHGADGVDAVLEAVDGLPEFPDGGTHIFSAVDRALAECKAHPSEVGAHHIVLVSDGMDPDASRVQDLLPKMKENGVVFDFIFIEGSTEANNAIMGSWYMEAAQAAIKVLKEVCEATGGEFQIVKTKKDFLQKFLAASNRKALPPAR